MGQGDVQSALRKITQRLRQLDISYAVAGGMALFVHGVRRFTEDVDILVSPDGLRQIHQHLEGRGFVVPFARSKNLRDSESGVRIEFLVEGEYPGDGKPKPVAFPAPASVSVELDGINYVNLATLVNLKLASGMTNAERLKDLADVQELIKTLALPEDFATQLAEYVRPKYRELWRTVRPPGQRYLRVWPNKSLATVPSTIEQMIEALGTADKELEQLRAAGVEVDHARSRAGDYTVLVTTDAEVARQFGMQQEAEFWGLDEGPVIGDPPDDSA